ncbi:MAG: hypothetical protein HYX41_02220 [Bdellovibrio sp.]|nr:hypothetical protein [Bdellovibrio sp.]
MLKKWVPVWIIPVLIVFSIGTVWLRLKIIGTAYLINETNRQIERSRVEQELLQVKLAALRSPRRLELLAKNRFGLGLPKVDRVIHLPKEQTPEAP